MLVPGAQGLLNAFWELSTDRAIGMAQGPIPHSSIVRYCEAAGLTPDEADEFKFYIRLMDTHYLKHSNKSTEDDIGRPLSPGLFDSLTAANDRR